MQEIEQGKLKIRYEENNNLKDYLIIYTKNNNLLIRKDEIPDLIKLLQQVEITIEFCTFCDQPATILYEWDVHREYHCLTKQCINKVGIPQPDARVLRYFGPSQAESANYETAGWIYFEKWYNQYKERVIVETRK